MPVQVAVCGPGECTDLEAAQAYEVGELLAIRGAVMICGGGAGVMAAAAAGAQVRGGLTVGILPAGTHDRMSTDLSVTIATGMGEARNAIIAASADAVIVIGGSWGTLSELALAKRRGDVPVVALGGWRILDADRREVGGIRYVASPADAVAAALPRS
jgi:uncharacterized protein (TIGR00725 family)